MPYKREEFVALLQRMQHGGNLNAMQADNVADVVEKLLDEAHRSHTGYESWKRLLAEINWSTLTVTRTR